MAGILENWRDTKFEKRLHELAAEEETFQEVGDNKDAFLDAIRRLVDANQDEFGILKTKRRLSELTEEEKDNLRKTHKTRANTEID